MRAIKEAKKIIKEDPADPAAQVLSRLMLALKTEEVFSISDIYELDFERFSLAMRIIDEWRLERYYEGKGHIFNIPLQTTEAQLAQ